MILQEWKTNMEETVRYMLENVLLNSQLCYSSSSIVKTEIKVDFQAHIVNLKLGHLHKKS